MSKLLISKEEPAPPVAPGPVIGGGHGKTPYNNLPWLMALEIQPPIPLGHLTRGICHQSVYAEILSKHLDNFNGDLGQPS